MLEALALLNKFDQYFTSMNGVDVDARISVPRDEWRALKAVVLKELSGKEIAERLNICDAAKTYYSRYAQDEASEDAVEHTGCTEQQHQDACALRDALMPIFGDSLTAPIAQLA